MTKIMKCYTRNIRLLFPVYHKYEKRFFMDFQTNVQEYVDVHPECSMDNLIEEFGTPKDVICEYLSSMDSEYYLTHIKSSKNIKFGIFITTIAIVILFMLRVIFLLQVKQEAEKAIVTTEQTIIEYKN
ncbi:DUF6120 family protein [uncultured Robinsoniella sp.]|uniref:DUF6120 family protein n=1 Tax=uncultured Robinsoniella sp. TaxID=904190 RepID=UPI00374F0D66